VTETVRLLAIRGTDMRHIPLYLQSPLWAAMFFSCFVALFLHEAWVFWRDRRKVQGERRDRGSVWVIMLLQNVGWYGAFAIPWITSAGRIPLDPQTLFFTAIAIFWLGWLLRLWSVLTLGRFFRTTVVVQEDHQLITSGPYRVLRNPSYTGALLMFLGLGLAQGNFLSVASIIAGGVLGYAWRIHAEELALKARFGQGFDDYRRRTWAIVPLVW
jgi:protein-S-isoprenylcysteine O-methyltransferase